MKLYYDNKPYDDQQRYPACRPYPYRRYCDYDYGKYYDYDRKGKDCDKEKEYEKKCICECRECEECNDKHEYRHCCPKSPCPYPVLFECACGTGTKVGRSIINGNTTAIFYPKPLGCLTIDTTCLRNPVVKFDFCSIIHFESGGGASRIRLVFGLFKTCDEGQEIPCGTWNYEADLPEGQHLTTSFNFCHCECNSCPGCCTYTVKLIEVENQEADHQLDICNVMLSAIAKSGC